MNTKDQMNILLVAEEAVGVQAFRLILKSNHNLSGVLTTIDSKVNEIRHYVFDEMVGQMSRLPHSTLSNLAHKNGIPVQDASRVQVPGFARWMESNHIDILLNVHSLYRICPDVINATRIGAFNLHPGPLPNYAGLNAPSWAVYNEESTHSVTIHHLTDKIDTGNIVYERQFPLQSKDTGLSVSVRCAVKGLELIDRLLKELNHRPYEIPSFPQNLSKRYVYKRNEVPGGGTINWSEPAHKIDAFVRACNYAPFPSPWGEPKTGLGDLTISVLKTTISKQVCTEIPGTVSKMIDGKTAVSTGDTWILIDKCKVNGEATQASTVLNAGDRLTTIF